MVALVCFMQGTGIRTEHGEVPVESVKLGDRVMTVRGESAPVRWIGRLRIAPEILADQDARRAHSPVVIRRHAIADNVPSRDLYVSPSHAFPFNGAMVKAGAMVNGLTVVQRFDIADVRYFHLGFDSHEMVYANGMVAESYLDIGNSQYFDVVESDLTGEPPRHVYAEVANAEAIRRDMIAGVALRAKALKRRGRLPALTRTQTASAHR